MNKLRVIYMDGEEKTFNYDEIYHRDTYILLVSGRKDYVIPLFNVRYTAQL